MIRIYTFLLALLTTLALTAQTNPAYIRLADQTGFEPTAAQLAELEAAALQLRAAFPDTNHRRDFAVFDFGFYLHSEQTTGGYPEAFQMAIDSVKQIRPYYLLFGRQSTAEGLNGKFWVDLKLPDTGEFSCIDSISSTMRSDFNFKYKVLANKVHKLNNKESSLYHLTERTVMDSVISKLVSIIDCCEPGNKNKMVVSCNSCWGSDEIADHFRGEGYIEFPITIVARTEALQPVFNKSDSNAPKVFDFSGYIYRSECESDKGDVYYEKGNWEIEIDRLTAPPYEGLNAKVFITDDDGFCVPTLKDNILKAFDAQALDYGIHLHFFLVGPNRSAILFYKKFPAIEKKNKVLPIPVQGTNQLPRPIECEPLSLPNNNSIQSYATTFDVQEKRYFGYRKVNGSWRKSSVAEYNSTRPDPTGLTIRDKGAYRTFLRKALLNKETGTIDTIYIWSFFPSREAYEMAVSRKEYFSTEALAYTGYFWFVEGGTKFYIHDGFRDDLDLIFNHFVYKQGQYKHNHFCNSEVSKGIYELPQLKQFINNGIDSIFRHYLRSHDDIDGVFDIHKPFFDQLQSPQLNQKSWVGAAFGGTQGYKVQIKRFLKDQCRDVFEVDYILTIYDTYGFDWGDGERRPPPADWGWAFDRFPGLIELWVLQHYRNDDPSYPKHSSSRPAFCPITLEGPYHSFEVLHKFKFTRDLTNRCP
jgi:hypothetical protein